MNKLPNRIGCTEVHLSELSAYLLLLLRLQQVVASNPPVNAAVIATMLKAYK